MAAKPTVPEFRSSIKSPISKFGVLTLSGFAIRVRMRNGHLEIEDGVGLERRSFRLPRVQHGLKRLVIIGNDGYVSLEALRWLSDQSASLTFLDKRGKVLFVAGPGRPSDARLRRAQALAEHTGEALSIARELISCKLAGQERVVRDKLLDPKTAEEIGRLRIEVDRVGTMDEIRWLESQGASRYWAVWRGLPICFPKNDLRRVPDHWLVFDTRKSPLTGSQRLACDPANAILNYLYGILESEARFAAAAVGLDPGLGFIHMDAPARDSLACDVMEVARPEVDAWVLDWVTREPLKRSWFVEQPDGNCRITTALAAQLGQTAPMWARAVAPVAEWVARQLWTRRRDSRETGPATRLTQSRKREVKGRSSLSPAERIVKPPRLCRGCGKEIDARYTHCLRCATPPATERLRRVAHAGRIASHTPDARRKQGNTQRQQRQAEAIWSSASQPDWLTEKFFAEQIQPKLTTVSTSLIASRLGVSWAYAALIRKGHRPHPRHWQALALLAGLSTGSPATIHVAR